MVRTVVPPITVRDYRQLPEGPPHFQLIEGDLFMSPSPKLFHQHVILNLARIVGGFLEVHPLGQLVIAPSDVVLGEVNVYQPDLYFVAAERRRILTEQGAEGPPDLVVEVLSTGTAEMDRGTKRKVYARCGVKELWLVDPDAADITVYRFGESPDSPVARLGKRQLLKSPLLPGLRLKVADVFKRPGGR